MTANQEDSAFIEELYSVRLWSIIGTVQPYENSIEDTEKYVELELESWMISQKDASQRENQTPHEESSYKVYS